MNGAVQCCDLGVVRTHPLRPCGSRGHFVYRMVYRNWPGEAIQAVLRGAWRRSRLRVCRPRRAKRRSRHRRDGQAAKVLQEDDMGPRNNPTRTRTQLSCSKTAGSSCAITFLRVTLKSPETLRL